MSAADILKMIEEVSPDDTAKLDEIDCRVAAYINGGKPHFIHRKEWVHSRPNQQDAFGQPQYTRSRDALKAIRPEGWYFIGGMAGGYADMKATKFLPDTPEYTGHQYDFKTEELAELHAIIQAMEYERNNPPTVSND